MFTYPLPQKVETDLDGYNELARIFKHINNQEDPEITINFDGCVSFDANLSAALGAILMEFLSNEGHRVWLSRPKAGPVRKSLSRIHFLRAWDIATNVEEREYYIPYRQFRSNDETDFKKYLDEQLLHKQKFPQHSETAGGKIQESIFEIYANAVSHGETNYVYSCGEYKEDRHMLDMTIVDCGITIPSKVNRYMSDHCLISLSPIEAVKWAFVSGNTTKNEAGGLGLAILKEFISLNEGALQVVSDNAFLEMKGDKVESFLLDLPFPGTIVNMRFNFDDKKSYRMSDEVENINPNDFL